MHKTPRFFGGRESTLLLREEQCFVNPPSSCWTETRREVEEGGGRWEERGGNLYLSTF